MLDIIKAFLGNINLWTALGILLVAAGTFLTIIGQGISSNKEISALKNTVELKNSKIDDLVNGKNELIGGNATLINQNIELLSGKDKMIDQNIELKETVESYQKQLIERETKIKELERKVKNAKFGVKDQFLFDGSISPTGMSGFIGQGPVHELFLQLSELEKENSMHSWLKVRNICDEKIKTMPEYFTLYLFRGKSLSFMGFKKEAIEDYEFVIENAPDNSDFTNFAHQLLNELKSK